jgi:hypothetical protein
MEDKNLISKVQFHKFWVSQVKEQLNASYVGWEKSGETYSLIINLKNIEGVKKRLQIPINGEPSDTTSEHYKDLIQKFHGKV